MNSLGTENVLNQFKLNWNNINSNKRNPEIKYPESGDFKTLNTTQIKDKVEPAVELTPEKKLSIYRMTWFER